MMQLPKNRKGKKPAYFAPVAAMFLFVAVLGMQFGCTDSTTAPSEAEQTTLEQAIYGTVFGDVYDMYKNDPLRNVLVTMPNMSGPPRNVRTDLNGRFQINDVYLGTVTALSGGAGLAGGGSPQTQTADFAFPLYFDVDSHATWKEKVTLSYEYIVDNGTIVVPSGTFFEVGETRLMPYVQSFTGTVMAGDEPAKGVTVMLDHTNAPFVTHWPYCPEDECLECTEDACSEPDLENGVRLANSFAVTNNLGVFAFDLDDKVVAYSNYEIIAYPYDVPVSDNPPNCLESCEGSDDPNCVECLCFDCLGDGHYEWDSAEECLNLTPKVVGGGSHFDLVGFELDENNNPIVVQTLPYEINLRDAENCLQVLSSSLANVGVIPESPQDFSITVTFNRPVLTASFSLKREDGLSVPFTREDNTVRFEITPVGTLTPLGGKHTFTIESVVDYMRNTCLECTTPGCGGDDCCQCDGDGENCQCDEDCNCTTTCAWDFYVGGAAPTGGPLQPMINVDVESEQNHSRYAADWNAIYRLPMDYGSGDNDFRDLLADADLGPACDGDDFDGWQLRVAFDPAGSGDYVAYFMESEGPNRDWVGGVDVDVTYQDNQRVEGTILIPATFNQAPSGLFKDLAALDDLCPLDPDPSHWTNWPQRFAPLFDGNQLWITILTSTDNPAILANVDPDSDVLILSDGWGPMIASKGNNEIFGGSNGADKVPPEGDEDPVYYDESLDIPFHEVLARPGVEVDESSDNFGVAESFIDDESNFVTAQFIPTVVATLAEAASKGDNVLEVTVTDPEAIAVDGFYLGDALALYMDVTGDGALNLVPSPLSGVDIKTEDGLVLAGFDQSEGVLIIQGGLAMAHPAGTLVAMVGPMCEGFPSWSGALARDTDATATYIAVAEDDMGNLPQDVGAGVLIIDGQLAVIGGMTDETNFAICSLDRRLLSAYPAGTSIVAGKAGFGDDPSCGDTCDDDTVSSTVLIGMAAAEATSIEVEDLGASPGGERDIAVGDWLKITDLLTQNEDYVQVASVTPNEGDNGGEVGFATGLYYSYTGRLTTVVEVSAVLTTVTQLAYPMVDICGSIDGLLAGRAITIVDPSVPENLYPSRVLSTYSDGSSNWVGLEDVAPIVCEQSCQFTNFEAADYCTDPPVSVVSVIVSRTEDSVQVTVSDTSGNPSTNTDTDGDGAANFDELELWNDGRVK
jgi:hypothetical protein